MQKEVHSAKVFYAKVSADSEINTTEAAYSFTPSRMGKIHKKAQARPGPYSKHAASAAAAVASKTLNFKFNTDVGQRQFPPRPCSRPPVT